MHWTVSEHQPSSQALLLDNPVLSFENFNAHALALVAEIGARECERHWGADRHAWVVEFEGCHLMLEFEDYTNSAWFAPIKEQDKNVLVLLAEKLRR